MTPRQWGLLSVLAVLWGGAFFFGKVALGELRPFTVVLVRFGVAAIAMQLVVRVSGHRMPRSGRTWVGFLVLGALNNFVPFSLIAWGQVQITSGLASILNATTPLFTAVVAHAWGQERLAAHRVGGVLLGLGGVAVLIGPGALRHLGASTLGELAIVGAAISYAFAGAYGRRFRAMPAVVPVAGMLTTSALLALPPALALDHPWAARPGVATAGALLGLALLSTALGFLIYFRLLSSVGATNVMLVTLLIPVTALLLGSLLLHEPVAGTALAGMALIFSGLLAIDGRLLPRRLRPLRPPPPGPPAGETPASPSPRRGAGSASPSRGRSTADSGAAAT
jgi:drug/metabolite transporter (DMT)-like permease